MSRKSGIRVAACLHPSLLVAVACSIVAGWGDSAWAQTPLTWNVTSGVWQTGANWLGGSPPTNDSATNTAVFSGTANETSSLNADASIAGLVFSNAGTKTLRSDSTTARAFSVGASGITINSGAGAVTLGNGSNPLNMRVVSNQTWANNSANTFTVLGPIQPTATSGSTTLSIGGAGTTTLSGTFANNGSGVLSLTKNNAGTLVLNAQGASSGTQAWFQGGDITVNAGRLQIGDSEVSASGFFTTGSRTITVNSGGTMELVYRNVFGTVGGTPPSTTVIIDGGVVTSSAGSSPSVNVLRNLTLRNSGTLLAAGSSLSSGSSSTGFQAFQLTGTVTVSGSIASSIATTGTAGVTIGNGADNTGITAFDVADVNGTSLADLTISAAIWNSNVNNFNVGSLLKLGAGTLVLSASNRYTGSTQVSGGVLAIGGGGTTGSLVSSSAITVDSGATLAFNRTDDYGGGFANTISGSGGVTLLSGSLTFGNAKSYAGATTITGGVLRIGESGTTGSLSTSSAITNNGAIIFNRSNAVSQGTDFSGSAITGTGSLTQAGAGTLTLNAANTYTGKTFINGGIVAITADNNLGAAPGSAVADQLSLNGGTLQFSGSTALGLAANRGITIGSAGGTLSVISTSGNPGLTINGGVSGSSALTISGSLNGGQTAAIQLSGSNSFSGAINVTGNGTVLGLENVNAVSNAASLTLGAGARLSPGAAIASGTITINNLTGAGTINASYGVSPAGTVRTININTTSDGVFSGAINDGSSQRLIALMKSGAAALTLSGSNAYTGATAVNAGRLEIASGGSVNSTSGITINGATAEFKYNSSTVLTRPITFTRGTLSGTGTINTPVSIGANAILSPGNSPGTQTYQSGTFASGGSYTWEISNWTSGTAGVNFDQAIFTNGLAITSSTASPFTINLTSLKADNSAGAVPNFNSGLTGLSFAIATGSMTGYSPSVFTLGTSSFFTANTVSGSANGGFWLSTNSGSDQLILNYAPSARYTLSATPSATAVYAGGTTTITGSIASSTADRTGADAMRFSSLSVGSGSLSVTSGTLAAGAGMAGTVNFSSGSAGLFTFTPTVSATNVNLGTAALAGTVTSGTVTVWNPAAVNTIGPVTLGNVRVSGTFGTSALTITNTAAGGSYTEVLGATGSTSGIASLTGSVSSLAGGSTSTAISVGLGGSTNTSTAGVKSGSATLLFTSTGGPGTASIASQTVAVTGTVWNYAAATIASGTSINLGTVLTGTPLTQALSMTNSAPATFSEKLDAAFGALTGGATTNSGSFSQLVAGDTNSSSMTVGLGSLTAGTKSGGVQVNFTSNGQGTSGLGTASIGSQTVSLAATVLDPATALLVGGSSAGSNWFLNLGEFQQASGTSSPIAFGISNLTQTAGFTADLFLASFANPTSSGAIFTDLTGTSSFATLASGSTNSFTAWMSLATTGSFTNVYTLAFNSSNSGTSLGGTPQNVTLTVTGVIIVPEPEAFALAGISVAALAWSLRRQRWFR
ncbi:MAG: autotransporter-associated beta strand repeat-containing protein [Planctomycetia bacterium]|nr:autotransporter-associated beta strand repeat-containing protein [Planctomycetia bacterium]